MFWALEGSLKSIVGSVEDIGGNLDAFLAAEFDIFVLDVDQHVWVNAVQGTEELRPLLHIMTLAQSNKVPGGILWPFICPFIAAQIGSFF